MAVQFLTETHSDFGLDQRLAGSLVFSGTYQSGGEGVSAKDLRFRNGSRLDRLTFGVHPTCAFEYESERAFRGKILIYQATRGAVQELAAGADLSGLAVPLVAEGR